MAQRRSGTSRGGPRGGPHESGEEAQLWAEIKEQLVKLDKLENKAKELTNAIFDKEKSIRTTHDVGERKL